MPNSTMDRKTQLAQQRKQQLDERHAAMAKAKRVYISGLKGHHAFELGVAYHFRGHQLYSFPGGEPIAPTPFKTKHGVNIVSTTEGLVPVWDEFAAGLVEEETVGALSKSCAVFWEEAEAERERSEVRRALETETCVDDDEEGERGVELPVVRRTRANRRLARMANETSLVPAQVLSRTPSRAVSREASHVDLSALAGSGEAPRPRSMRFVTPASATDLASMVTVDDLLIAPRSLHRSSSSDLPNKHSSPFARKLQGLSSQPSSSTSLADLGARHDRSKSGLSSIPGLGHSSTSLAGLHTRTSSAGIMPTIPGLGHSDSSPSLTTLNREQTDSPGPYILSSYPRVFGETFYTPNDRARWMSDSLPGSRLASAVNTPFASRPVSPTLRPSHLQVPRTIRGTHSLLRHVCSVTNGYADLGTTTAVIQYGPSETAGSDQQRRASMVLNQAYNEGRMGEDGVGVRAPKCAVHGEDCDGVTVTETWKTEHAQQTGGFREVYPMIEGDGDRIMVDWARLLRQEQERRRN